MVLRSKYKRQDLLQKDDRSENWTFDIQLCSVLSSNLISLHWIRYGFWYLSIYVPNNTK